VLKDAAFASDEAQCFWADFGIKLLISGGLTGLNRRQVHRYRPGFAAVTASSNDQTNSIAGGKLRSAGSSQNGPWQSRLGTSKEMSVPISRAEECGIEN